MRFVAFEFEGRRRLGVRIGDEVADLSSADSSLPDNLDALLGAGEEALRRAAAAADRALVRHAFATIRFRPPVANPAKVICVGLNYVDHAAESPYKDPPKYPVLFSRFPSSYVAHREPLVRPRVSADFDYEGELVALIGKGGRYIPKQQALQYVAGYTLFNDGSLRDYQFKSTQWLMGKNFDRSGSCGPEFVTADELPEGAKGLRLQTRLNGERLQDANTRDLIFDVATLVSVCSEAVALQPGDLIVTGTPAGVGFVRKPPIYMKPGDLVEVEVDGIGVLANPIIEEES